MHKEPRRFRALLVEAIKANPAAIAVEPELIRSLEAGSSDVTFEDLGFDSLARMELAIWLQLEAGIVVGENELALHPSVDRLAGYLEGGAG